jgi:hypothetical protein
MSGLLFVVAPFLIGLALGTFTNVPVRLLALPPLALALTYWIAFGWHGDDYDIGRAGLVIFTGALGGGVVACWVAGCGVGRFVRRDYLTR